MIAIPIGMWLTHSYPPKPGAWPVTMAELDGGCFAMIGVAGVAIAIYPLNNPAAMRYWRDCMKKMRSAMAAAASGEELLERSKEGK